MCEQIPIDTEQVIEFLREQREIVYRTGLPKVNNMELAIYDEDGSIGILFLGQVSLSENETFRWQPSQPEGVTLQLRGLA